MYASKVLRLSHFFTHRVKKGKGRCGTSPFFCKAEKGESEMFHISLSTHRVKKGKVRTDTLSPILCEKKYVDVDARWRTKRFC